MHCDNGKNGWVRKKGLRSVFRLKSRLDREKSPFIEENTRLQRALHLLLAIWPVGTDVILWEQWTMGRRALISAATWGS